VQDQVDATEPFPPERVLKHAGRDVRALDLVDGVGAWLRKSGLSRGGAASEAAPMTRIPDGHELYTLTTSTDGAHWAATSEAGDHEHVLVDGSPSKAFADVSRPLFIGEGGAVVYRAKDEDGATFMVHPGCESGPWKRVSQLAAGGGRSACLAKDAKRKTALVIDGELADTYAEAGDVTVEGGVVSFWASMSGKKGVDAAHKGKEVIFLHGGSGLEAAAVGKSVSAPVSRDGELVAYLEAGSKWAVWWRGEALGKFEWVTPPAVDGKGSSLAFGVRTKGRWGLWKDGAVSGDHDDLAKVAISQDGAHVAYATQDGDLWRVRDSGGGSSIELQRVSTVAVTKDGRAVWVGRDGEGLKVGIGDEVHGPYEGLGATVVCSDGSVRYRAAVSDDLHAIFVDGAPGEDRYELLSNPVDTADGPVAHGLRDGAIHRVTG